MFLKLKLMDGLGFLGICRPIAKNETILCTIHAVLPVISFAAGTGKISTLCRRQIGKTGKSEKAKIDPP